MTKVLPIVNRTITTGGLAEGGVYTVSVGEDDGDDERGHQYGDWDADLDEAAIKALEESVPKGAPASDFADPPSGLYVGDAKHARLAVQAVTSGLRGNKAKASSSPGVKSKIASAIRKFYKGDQQKYYLSWLHSGKKPDKKPASEISHGSMAILTPSFTTEDEDDFPEIEISPRVNMVALMAAHEDTQPKFVTRPLAILGAISENGLVYNQAIFDGVYEQVLTKRVPARLGHVADDAKGSSFPPDAGYWVGAVVTNWRGQPTVFGKCYLVPGEARRMILSREATGTPISNSLYGDVTTATDAQGMSEPVSVVIETIDFVPAERAALQQLGGEFVVTSEMTQEDDMAGSHEAAIREAMRELKAHEIHEALHETGKAHEVAAYHVQEAKCKECGDVPGAMFSEEGRAKIAEAHLRETATPDETYDMLPNETRKHVAEAYAKEAGMKLVEESKMREEEAKVKEEEKMREESKMKEMTTQMSEMATVLKRYQRQEFDRALDDSVNSFFVDWQVKTEAGREKLAALKTNLRREIVSEMAGSTAVEDVAAAAGKAWPSIKPLAETVLASLAGPSLTQTVSVNGAGGAKKNGWNAETGRYEDDFVASAVRNNGALGGRPGGTR